MTSDIQWNQATLPMSHGGLGIRKVSDIALPAFLSSTHSVLDSDSTILCFLTSEFQISHIDQALDTWRLKYGDVISDEPHVQKSWDSIVSKSVEEKCVVNNHVDIARLLAVQSLSPGLGSMQSHQEMWELFLTICPSEHTLSN
uniref:Uncharacterized protein n=1 Tax=Cacopsylla melanoneura TaxID=428564 RepID=A0A8D8ZB39_9HEMI